MDVYEIRRRALTNAMHARCNGKQKSLADAIGRRPDYVSRVLHAGPNNKRVSGDMARTWEESLGLPPGWLDLERNAGTDPLVPAARADVTAVPPLEHTHHRPPTGFWGVPLFTADLQRLELNTETLRAAAVTDAGMWCQDGLRDYVAVIDTTATTPIDGAIYLIDHGNRLKLRRLVLDGSTWVARARVPADTRYPDVDVADVEIIGRFVWGGGATA